MEYKLFRLRDREPVEALEAHVLVHAYTAAWRKFYLSEPSGEHFIESLGLAIDFCSGEPRPARLQ